MQQQDQADGGVAVLVFVQVELGELERFLDADAGVAQDLDDGQAPERVFFVLDGVGRCLRRRRVAVCRDDPGVRLVVQCLVDPGPLVAGGGEGLAG